MHRELELGVVFGRVMVGEKWFALFGTCYVSLASLVFAIRMFFVALGTLFVIVEDDELD